VLGTVGDDEQLRRDTKLGQALITDGGPARLFSPLTTLDGGSSRAATRTDEEEDCAFPPSATTAAPPQQQSLPLMFYLPGLDGSGLAASNQFPPLSRAFELRCLALPPADRMDFPALVDHVSALVERDVRRDCDGGVGSSAAPRRRPVYLLGESFGGVLALAVAERLGPALVDRLVLVNPATSFAESVWPRAGGVLASLPDPLYRALPLLLSPVLSNPLALAQAAAEAERVAAAEAAAEGGGAAAEEAEQDPVPEPIRRASDALYALLGLMPQLSALRLVLPRDTLAHRLQLLQEGAAAARALLPRVQQRALILAGELDLLIPSADEAKLLEQRMPRARSVVLKGRSHALLQEQGVDLVETLREQGFYVERRLFSSDGPLEDFFGAEEASADKKTQRKRKSGLRGGRLASAVPGAFGTAAPIELPTPRELDLDAERFVATLRRLTSPVFFSTDPRTGAVRQGLQHVPLGRGALKGRPVLLVGNHQLFAADMYGMVHEFLRERGAMVRGLAHPVVFGGAGGAGGSGVEGKDDDDSSSNSNSSSNNNSGGPASFGAFLSTYGAVPVSPFNLHALLAAGETALLFPGGAREAFKRRDEEYRLFWTERSEFVRMAARFGAMIVPFAAVGADEAVVQVLTGPELAELRERVPAPLREAAERAMAGGRGNGGNGGGSNNASSTTSSSTSRPLPVARRGVNAEAFDEDAFANALPLIAPNGPPRRLYFKFGAPIETSPEMANDREACDALYTRTKSEVEEGLQWLLDNRGRDPYGDFLPRVLWEAAPWNNGKQAPTFKP
jgi:pimeloyl-ACP methyl ester carboxylesterase